jgi:Chaperone of endosialidase
MAKKDTRSIMDEGSDWLLPEEEDTYYEQEPGYKPSIDYNIESRSEIPEDSIYGGEYYRNEFDKESDEVDPTYSNEGRNAPPATPELLAAQEKAILDNIARGDWKVLGNQIVDQAGNIVKDLYESGGLGALAQFTLDNVQLNKLNAANEGFRKQATNDLTDLANRIAAMPLVDLQKLLVAQPSLIPFMQQQTGLKNITTDPRSLAAAQDSLRQLNDVSNKGYTAIERAATARVLGEMANRNQAQQAAIKSDLASRGQYGAGEELTARMLASQANANLAAQQGLDIEAQAAQRALQAIRDKGNLGMSMNQQEFGQEAQKASAQDTINAFNANLQNQINAANLAQQNTEQQRRIAAAQQEQANAFEKQKNEAAVKAQAGANATKLFGENNEIIQNMYSDRNKAIANSLTPKAPQVVINNTPGTVGTGGTSGGTTGGKSNTSNTVAQVGQAIKTGKDIWDVGNKIWDFFSDERVKEQKKDLSDDEIMAIFDKLSPKEFAYKESVKAMGAPGGKMVGVMAQDLEKSNAKGMIKNTNGVKTVDGDKAISLALAGLTSMNKRLKDLEK